MIVNLDYHDIINTLTMSPAPRRPLCFKGGIDSRLEGQCERAFDPYFQRSLAVCEFC